MKTEITYTGNAQIRVKMGDGTLRLVEKGKKSTIKRGDIPNDAFDALALRPDFGGSLEAYRASRSPHVPSAPAPAEEVASISTKKKVKE